MRFAFKVNKRKMRKRVSHNAFRKMTPSQLHALFELLDQTWKLEEIYDAYSLTLAECAEIRNLTEGKSLAELRQLERDILEKRVC